MSCGYGMRMAWKVPVPSSVARAVINDSADSSTAAGDVWHRLPFPLPKKLLFIKLLKKKIIVYFSFKL